MAKREPKRSLPNELDLALQELLAKPHGVKQDEKAGAGLAPLLDIAQGLRDLPRENFKARLKSDLERQTSMATASEALSALQQTATPRLRIKNAAAAIDFYTNAFGAKEVMRFTVYGE